MLPRSSSHHWLTSTIALVTVSALAVSACNSDDTAIPAPVDTLTSTVGDTGSDSDRDTERATAPVVAEPAVATRIAVASIDRGETAIAGAPLIAPASVQRGSVALAIPVITPPATVAPAVVAKGTTSTVVTTTTTTTVPSTSTTSTTTSTTVPAPLAIDACLAGDWTISDADRDAYYGAIAAAAGFDSMVVNGSVALTFGEVDAHLARHHDATIVIGDNTFTFRFDGTWTATSVKAADGTITARDAVFNGAGVTDMRLNGEPVDDAGDLLVGVFSIDPLDGMGYSCDDGTIGLPIGEFGDTQFTATLIVG